MKALDALYSYQHPASMADADFIRRFHFAYQVFIYTNTILV